MNLHEVMINQKAGIMKVLAVQYRQLEDIEHISKTPCHSEGALVATEESRNLNARDPSLRSG